MSPELLATLRKWQASEDPVERAHARWRLSQPDTLSTSEMEDKPAQIPINEPPLSFDDRIQWIVQVQSCPWRTDKPNCSCPGKARCSQYLKDVTVNDCVTCIQSGLQNLEKYKVEP